MAKAPCYCHALRKATRRITQVYDAALAEVGITLAQFSLLRNIKHFGAVSPTKLGQVLELDRSTVGRNVKLLERLGLVEPGAAEDRREAAVQLSVQGREVLTRAMPLWHGVQRQLEDRIGPERLAALVGELDEI